MTAQSHFPRPEQLTLSELGKALDGTWLMQAPDDAPVTSIAEKVERVKAGCLLLATRDDFYNDIAGNLAKAFHKGARLAVIRQQKREISQQLDTAWSVLSVESISDTLYRLAHLWRQTNRGLVVAITGSAGKTSTTNALGQILSNFGRTYLDRKSVV